MLPLLSMDVCDNRLPGHHNADPRHMCHNLSSVECLDIVVALEYSISEVTSGCNFIIMEFQKFEMKLQL